MAPCSLRLAIRRNTSATMMRRQPQRRLVEHQQARPGHQRPADRQHLLLAAGQRAGDLAAALGEAREPLEDAGEVGLDLAVVARVARPSSRFSSTVSGASTCRPSGTWHAARSAATRSARQPVMSLPVEADRARRAAPAAR